MIFTKFHENRLIIDGEINEKHALLVECEVSFTHLKLWVAVVVDNLIL